MQRKAFAIVVFGNGTQTKRTYFIIPPGWMNFIGFWKDETSFSLISENLIDYLITGLYYARLNRALISPSRLKNEGFS